MKTESTNPMTEVSNILSPVRVLKIDDFMRIAENIRELAKSDTDICNRECFKLLSRFESLTSQPLTKERLIGLESWFEGFGTFEGSIQAKSNGRAIRVYINEPSGMYIGAKYIQLTSPTVFDIIYQIDLFNGTAQSKININYSQNFIKELLQ